MVIYLSGLLHIVHQECGLSRDYCRSPFLDKLSADLTFSFEETKRHFQENKRKALRQAANGLEKLELERNNYYLLYFTFHFIIIETR